MGLYRSLAGLVRLEVTSADIPGLLDFLGKKDIALLDAVPEGELILRFSLRRQDLSKLKEVCNKRGDILKIAGRTGLYWSVKSLFSRPVLLVGMAWILFFLLWIPTHVFFIEVEGNAAVPSRKILEAAQQSGICFGASRREVRSEKVKNALLEEIPELQWAGVNTYGCVAVISVREKSITERCETEKAVTSIVAACDGVVLSATATAGNHDILGEAINVKNVFADKITICIEIGLFEIFGVFKEKQRGISAAAVNMDICKAGGEIFFLAVDNFCVC